MSNIVFAYLLVFQSDQERASTRLSPPAGGESTDGEETAPPLCPSNTSNEELAVVQVRMPPLRPSVTPS